MRFCLHESNCLACSFVVAAIVVIFAKVPSIMVE